MFLRFAFFKVLPGDYEILATHPTWALKEVSFDLCLWVCYSLEINLGMNLGCEMKSQFLQRLWKSQGAEDIGVTRENSLPQRTPLLLVSSSGDSCEDLCCHCIELSQHQKFPMNFALFLSKREIYKYAKHSRGLLSTFPGRGSSQTAS